ncbi:MAG: bis(5'-nucleosyl)-tetraphosphatase (symmetrical) YqeK [Clostridiales Family XIII bacterium]|jgi:HD superfamily phosphohydrolase YqeK|nr:bis(5'-nucleosyl)-tetraphosphatase (symmetrical) YqeK [Clostridiales Family XIII bacterium]
MKPLYLFDIDPDVLDAELRRRFSPSRYEHTQGTLDLAFELGDRFGEDPDKITLAALFHDFCKDEDGNVENNLLHGGLAADIMEREYGIADEDILNAVRYHTTGRRGMSRLELIIFLADTLEPGRTYSDVGRLREIALKDLYAAAFETLRSLGLYLERSGFEISPDNAEALEWLGNRMTCDFE